MTVKKDQGKAKEVFWLLNQFVGDLLTGTRILGFFETSPQFADVSKRMTIMLRRMCVFYLVVTLFKVEETFDAYKAIFPSDVSDARRKLKKEFDRRGIRKARNTVVGHIQDDKLQRPLTGDEVEIRLNSVVGDNLEAFRRWIHNPEANVFPDTVIAVCQHIRDRIAEENGL